MNTQNMRWKENDVRYDKRLRHLGKLVHMLADDTFWYLFRVVTREAEVRKVKP